MLASPLIDDLDLSRAQLGLIGSVNALVGAVSASSTGRLTDRIGARRSVVMVLVASAAAMACTAAAANGWWLAVAAAVGGVPQGWGNPATNSLISHRVAAGRRGSVTGVKQSGVTLGVFLSGASLPAMANAWGWRASVWVFAALFTVLAIVVALTLAPDPTVATSTSTSTSTASGSDLAAVGGRLDPFVWRVALYALLMGSAGGAVGRFFPLYAEESIGFSIETAGLLVAAGGLLGMAARVLVGRWAEHRIAPTRLLGILSTVGVAYCLLLASVTPSTRALLLVSPPLNAVGIAAWNAVAMLTIIMFVPTGQSGRASGAVMLGFLGGLAISAPLAGVTVDRWGTYRPVWLAGAVLAAAAAALMFGDRTGRGTSARTAPASGPS